MKVFSFCLYGTESNYYTGLLENIKIVQEFFPDFEIYVYKGICDPSWTIEGATVIETGREGAVNTLFRLLPLTFADIGFARDTDSRITERDRWTITEFLNSTKDYHIIRDHYYHKSKIMAGCFGWKKPLPDLKLDMSNDESYGIDERILERDVYPVIIDTTLVHTNIRAYTHEKSSRITIEHKDPTDFIGNVIWNGSPKFEYFIDVVSQVHELAGYDQFELMQYLSERINPSTIPYDQRSWFFERCYIANYYLNNIERAQYWISQFEFAEISGHVYSSTKFLISKMGKKVIASFDAGRNPSDNELVIIYGNYPDWHHSLPHSNKMFRHVSLFYDIQHDVVESHPVWDSLDVIYILNLEERVDRYYEILLALCNVKAPLHKIHHYKAKKDDVPAYIGATQNHVDVIQHFCNEKLNRCLILEDDFVFLDDKEKVWSSVQSLWETPLEYNICFLSLSKHGRREVFNELLGKTHQHCTTSSGYFLQKSTAQVVLDTTIEGIELMKSTGDHCSYCIDRYWSKLPNLFYFRSKLGFQRPCYSNLIRSVSAHLD